MLATGNNHDIKNTADPTYAEVNKSTQPIPTPRHLDQNSYISSISGDSGNSSGPLVTGGTTDENYDTLTYDKRDYASPTPPRNFSQGSMPNAKTDRFLQKFKDLMVKKKITMPFTALVTMLCVAFMNKPIIELIKGYGQLNAFNILAGVMLVSLALFGCWTIIQSFRTDEHKVTERNHSKVLSAVLVNLLNDKLIKYIMINRSNGERLYVELRTLQTECKGSSSISGKKIVKGHFASEFLCAISNRRIAVPMLFTALMFGGITLPLIHPGLNFAQIFSPALLTNPYAWITAAAIGLMVTCIMSNVCNTTFEKVLYLHGEKDCNPNDANGLLIGCIRDELAKEDKSREKKGKGPSSKIKEVVIVYQGLKAEDIFCVR